MCTAHVAAGLLALRSTELTNGRHTFFGRDGNALVLSASAVILVPSHESPVASGAPQVASILAPVSLLWPALAPSTQATLTAQLSQSSPAPVSEPYHLMDTSALPASVQLSFHIPHTLTSQPTQTSSPSYNQAQGSAPVPTQKQSATTSGLIAVPCQLQGFLVLPGVASALSTMLSDVCTAAGTSTGSAPAWQYAWGLGSVPDTNRGRHPPTQRSNSSYPQRTQSPMPAPANLGACFALLRPIGALTAAVTEAVVSQQHAWGVDGAQPVSAQHGSTDVYVWPGQRVLAVGSPFGCLAPHHFTNSAMQGVVSSLIPDNTVSPTDTLSLTTTSLGPPVITLDAPCLPGMEGGLVVATDRGCQCQGCSTQQCVHGRDVIGLLSLPLSRVSDGVQIQVAISWCHILQAWQAYTRDRGTSSKDIPALLTRVQASVATEHTWHSNCDSVGSQHSRYSTQPPVSDTHTQPGPLGTSGVPWQSVAAERGAEHQHTTDATDVPLCTSALPWEPSPGGNAHSGSAHSANVRSSYRRSHTGSLSHTAHTPLTPLTHSAHTPLTPLSQALSSVVLVRTSHSWATGVIVTPGGLVLTNAHLVTPTTSTLTHTRTPTAAADTAPSARPAAAQVARDPCNAACMVRVGRAGRPGRWVAAHVVYVFSNHLDLAVLQLQPYSDYDTHTGTHGHTGAHWSYMPLAPTTQLVSQRCKGKTEMGVCGVCECVESGREGHEVYVVGHGLVGPMAGWPAAVTGGNIARVVCVGSEPCMLITTATVHAGASGGAVVDRSGSQLLGLVTSNARHASGSTIPTLNFCIPASSLVSVVDILTRHEASHAPRSPVHPAAAAAGDWTASLDTVFGVTETRRALRGELDALNARDGEADRVWNLQMPVGATLWLPRSKM